MKEKLNGAFKATPQRFKYAVESSVNEALGGVKVHKTKKPIRVLVAVLLLIAIIPVAVFGAVKLVGIKPQKVGNYGMGFYVCVNKDAPQYIKMQINLPDEFCEVENTAKSKFHYVSNDEHAFTILPMRIIEDIDLATIETEVSSIEELSIASHKAYKLINTESYKGLNRYYVWYEEVNILMLIYRGEKVTDEEFEAFVSGIIFVEASEADHDEFYEPGKSDDDIDVSTEYEFTNDFILTDTDTEIVFSGYCKETDTDCYEVNSKITDIRVCDNAVDIAKEDVNLFYDYTKAVDDNGRLYPKVTELRKYGDGINQSTEIISSSHVNQKLILIDMVYTNTTDKELCVYVPHRLETLRKVSDNVYDLATAVDRYNGVFADSYCDGEIFYMSDHGSTAKDFYTITLLPNETKTLTIGFRCNEDQVDNAYIVFSAVTDGVISPQPAIDNEYTYYIFKVN